METIVIVIFFLIPTCAGFYWVAKELRTAKSTVSILGYLILLLICFFLFLYEISVIVVSTSFIPP